MKKIFTSFGIITALAASAQFTPNNLAVLRISNGGVPLTGRTGTAKQTNIVEFTTAGVATATNINLTGAPAATVKFVTDDRPYDHGGQLTLSVNRNFLSCIGYNGAIDLPSSGNTTIPEGFRQKEKRIARIGSNGVADLTTAIPTTDAFLNQTVRSAISNDGTSFTVVGSKTGGTDLKTIAYGGNTTTQFFTTSSTIRSLSEFNGDLFTTFSASATVNAINASGTATALQFSTPSLTNIEYTQLVFMDTDPTVGDATGLDLLYIADRNAGIRKFFFNGTTSRWTPVGTDGAYNPTSIGTESRFYAITGRIEGGKPTLYAIKIDGANTAGGVDYAGSYLIRIVDNDTRTGNWFSTATATLLASTDNTTMFKGVAFTPGSADVVLPIELGSFKASLVNNTVQLNWNTVSEINAKEFVVEKSLDGSKFSPITTVAAKNSNQANNYKAEDLQPANGLNYYRLKLTDKDGSFKFSKVLPINVAKANNQSLTVFPNPVVNTIGLVHAAAAQGAHVKITNAAGNLVLQTYIVPNAVQTSLDVSKLTAGQYFVTYTNQQSVTTKSFVK
jgi:hypothetical protein